MATLQTFKGPRMLIKFPGEWKENTPYEYMSAVYDATGQSWLSKTDVPAGAALEEGKYWVPWNAPNAQFALLQQTVQSFDQRITVNADNIKSNTENIVKNSEDIANKRSHIVIIGDSYSDQYYLPNGTLWCETVAQRLGCELHNYAEGGAGFVATSDHQKITFSQEIDQAASDDAFPNEQVAYVLILGGTNDLRENTSTNKNTLNNAIASTIQNAKSSFQHSNIIYLGSSTYANFKNKTMSDSEIICEYYIQDQCNNQVATAGLTFFWIGQPQFFTNGYVGHPNQLAHDAFANAVIGAISGGGNAFKHSVTVEPTLSDDVSGEYTLSTNGAGVNKFTVVMTNKEVNFNLGTQLRDDSTQWSGLPKIALPFNFRIPHETSNDVPKQVEIINVRVSDTSHNNLLHALIQYKSTNSLLVYPNIFGSTTSQIMDIYYNFPFFV